MLNSAYDSGQLAGRILPVLLVSLLLIKTIPLLKRKEYNTNSVLALTIIFASWLMMAVITGLQQWKVFPQSTVVFSSALFVLAALGALILGVIGLTELADTRNAAIKGRKHAVWAIVLSVFLVAVGAFAFIEKIKSGEDFSNNKTELQNPNKPPEIKRYEELNFQFELPQKPWVTLDAKKVNPDATLALMRSHPQMVFILIAEDIGKTMDLGTAGLVEIAKGNLKSVAESYSFLKEENKQVRGMNGTLMLSEGVLGKNEFIYAHWIYSDKRYGYQLITFAEKNKVSKKELLEGLNLMLSKFKRINVEPSTENQSLKKKEHSGTGTQN